MVHAGSDVERHIRSIFRRCVQCPPGPPSCPPCAADETCSLKAESCTACASTTCVQIGSLPGQAHPQQSTPVGAIAGGVIGGVAVIVLLTYLVYRFCIRNRRRDEQAWMDQKVEKRDQSALARADRQSTRSVASTVLTRASNVIQIAYIPGVTNRTPPDSPTNLVPPVPALPFGTSNTSTASTPHVGQDMHFFLPRDLRDSSYSNMTEDQRISLAPSLTRASVATTIYRNDAVVSSVPAQQAYRTRPAVVSVKPGANAPGSTMGIHSQAPPVPHIPSNLASTNSSIVARNVTARPIEVQKTGSGTSVPTLANLARSPGKQSKDGSVKGDTSPQYYDEKEVVLSPGTVFEDTSPTSPPMKSQHSFASYKTASSVINSPHLSSSPLREVHSRNVDSGLDAMIEDALNRAARDPTHTGLGSRPELRKQPSGPFSDSNEVKENLL